MYKNEWLKGSLRTILLKLMSERPRMYGYEISRMVEKRSGSNIRITEGALYPALHRLESQGYLIAERVQIGKRARKYYSLTAKGQTEAQENIEQYFSHVRTMLLLLSDKQSATP